MDLAMGEAENSACCGEVPVGAVIVDQSGKVLSQARNCMRERNDPTAHAEIVAIRDASARISESRLDFCSIYVTLEPCVMCTMAISLARIARLYYAAPDPKRGGVHSHSILEADFCYHRPEVYESAGRGKSERLLRAFFSKLR